MSILQIPLWIVSLLLFLLAAFKPSPSWLPLGLAFFVAGFLVAAV
jgi:hypothetical protein